MKCFVRDLHTALTNNQMQITVAAPALTDVQRVFSFAIKSACRPMGAITVITQQGWLRRRTFGLRPHS
jgi:tRNA(Met) C34 N-acetyltransferase TmcA